MRSRASSARSGHGSVAPTRGATTLLAVRVEHRITLARRFIPYSRICRLGEWLPGRTLRA